MQTARRFYVYLMSGVGLGVLVFGLRTLVDVLLDQAGLGPAEPGLRPDDATRQGLTVAFAAITVSLPVWLIHWFLAERSVRPDAPDADGERSSGIRGLYFLLALGIPMLMAALAATALIETTVVRFAGGDISFRSPAADIATVVVSGLAWAYHLRVRTRDWRAGRIEGAAAFLPRAYLYLAAFFGLIALASGINGLIEVLGRTVVEQPPEVPGFDFGPWWALPVARAVAAIAVGGAVWLGHSLYAERQRADAGWRGESERSARLRPAYFVAVILASAGSVAYFLSEAGRYAIESLLGVAFATTGVEQTALVLVSLLSAATFGVVWFLHQRRLRAEASTSDDPERISTAERLALHPPALVGLAVLAAGVALLIGLVIDAVLGADGLGRDASVRRQLAEAIPLILIGAVIWGRSWSAIRTRHAADPVAEGASTTRRTYLLVVLAGSVLAGISALGTILYRVFGSLFGLEAPEDPIRELSLPIGGVITAVVVALYHGQVLRRDQAGRAEVPAPAAEPPAEAVVVRVIAPPGTEAAVAVAAISERLPEGYAVEAEP